MRWTKSAVDCYNRGCRCEGCFYKDFFTKDYSLEYYNQKCEMKKTVIELVRVIGTPKENNYFEAEITKELLEDLYLRKTIRLVDIYSYLHITKYEFENLLDLYQIRRRKKPKLSGRLEGY